MRTSHPRNVIPKTITLPSGYEMPRLGYGVYQIPGEFCNTVVCEALARDYRHTDTTTAYRNDFTCAYVVDFVATFGIPSKRNAILPRSEIFFTNKLPPKLRGPIARGTRFQPPAVTPEEPNPPIPQGSEYLYELARKYQKTPAQILFRWSLQKGCVPIVKTVNRERMEENMGIWDWELEDEDVLQLETTEYKPHAGRLVEEGESLWG
ncbi:hypothetical protein L211DRAFT_845960 [Terfezia boudieri ATCC MYA-4762]|uniref:NADP-dependent oxidoreductase domain-containing protein n=1 Tax=Terfezia boudieri ATCC MYA-4762 TaxID=1051890 RepID=A0A3N4M276_9PEZI|nr:hypothetical protein L211DRAFT_845960 [Terfezia boudieri ATCC MYA-4762]